MSDIAAVSGVKPVELNYRKDTMNLLDANRKLSDIDLVFFEKFFLNFNVFDDTESNKALEDRKRYHAIIKSKPELFQSVTDLEINRHDLQILTMRKLKYYFTEAKKVQPLREVLNNIPKCFNFFEPITCHQEDIGVKLTVNLQLAYKTIENLGTDQHSVWKQRLEKGEDISCFALTELGHGSNVKGIMTTAIYDHQNKEFIINSPGIKSMKFWIGGAGKSSNISCVFAQLIINGVSHGPHAFIVPLRNRQTYLPLSGITIGDCGRKAGLDGIDNGFIMFNNVRIPKANMLNKLSNIDNNGVFSSPIKSSDLRFGLSLAGLSTGRIALVQNVKISMQIAIKNAIRFSVLREQFAAPGSDQEQALIDYQLHQYRLFPILASIFSYTNMLVALTDGWTKNQKKMQVPGNKKSAELHAMISVIKPIVSWSAFAAIAECRRACGGLGFSFYSNFSNLLSGNDINQTWEGDNNVLLQQTSKYLLDQFKALMNGKENSTITCQWMTIDDVTEDKCEAESIEDLCQFDSLKKIFGYRCNKLLQKLAMKMAQKTMGKKSPAELFNIWNESQVFGIQELALAYGEYLLLHYDINFFKKIHTNEVKYFSVIKDDSKQIMNLMFKLSHLTRMEKSLVTYFEDGYFTSDQGDMVREEITNLLPQFKRFAINITDMIKPEDLDNNCMISPGDGDLYKSVQNRIFTAPKAFERVENWQEMVIPLPKL